MLSNARISAVIPVTDLDRAREFYEDVLGLSVFQEEPEQRIVMYRSAGTYLTIYERPTPSSGQHTIASFEIEGDFDAVVDDLLAEGITFDTFEIPGYDLPWDNRGVLQDERRAAVWFKDPDGNVLTVGKSRS